MGGLVHSEIICVDRGAIYELRQIITPIAQEHGVESVSVFGSYSKGAASTHLLLPAETRSVGKRAQPAFSIFKSTSLSAVAIPLA